MLGRLFGSLRSPLSLQSPVHPLGSAVKGRQRMEITIFRFPCTLEEGEEQEVGTVSGLTLEQFELLARVVDDSVDYNWR